MKAERKAQIYRDVVILPADENTSVIRWTARLEDGTRFRTDTLRSMREMIREAKDNKRKVEVR